MKVVRTRIPEVLLLEPDVFGDDRGFFVETFNLEQFEAATGIERAWVQDNHSRSRRGVLRGLHYQNPEAQGKLVRCSRGSVFDVAVDLRKSSQTFLAWVGVELSAENHRQLWVPEGFGHGFLVTSDVAEIQYKATAYYRPSNEGGVAWDDPRIGIEWPLDSAPTLSQRDAALPGVADAELFA